MVSDSQNLNIHALYAGRKEEEEGATSCNVKVQGSRGTDGWKESLQVCIQRYELKKNSLK
jgi:hypothetical protein